MAKDIVTKFETLIRRLNYSQIRLLPIDSESIKHWVIRSMPQVVEELDTLGWDLSADRTWTETVFINILLKWYDKKVALFLTPSMVDYKLAFKVFGYPIFAQFRQTFGIDCQMAVLINPLIFLVPEDLDSIYLGLDFTKGYSCIDFSHFDENDELELEYQKDWDWLMIEEGDGREWTSFQSHVMRNH